MQNDAGRTVPYWTDTADLPSFGDAGPAANGDHAVRGMRASGGASDTLLTGKPRKLEITYTPP